MNEDLSAMRKCPAPAGMIPDLDGTGWADDEMPRTCGDDPNKGKDTGTLRPNAPHLRG